MIISSQAEPEASRPAAPDLSVTVVVTACVASPDLLHTLRAIGEQSLRPAQILLVDNRPATSGLADLLRQAALPDVTLLREPVPGLSWARNAGLAAATEDVVVFTDDDVLPAPGWLAALVSGFTDPDVACVTGQILPLELETQAQRWFEEFGGFSKGPDRRRFDLADHRDTGPLYPYAAGVFGSGANSAFRTADFRALGGFDVRLGTGTPARGGEDLDAYLTIVQAGRAIVYEPTALLWHRHHRDPATLRRQIHGYGVGFAAMLTKRLVTHPDERREIARRLGTGVRYLLDPRSAKNARKGRGYPGILTLAELVGMAQGPFAYWRSVRLARHAPSDAQPTVGIWCCEVELSDPTPRAVLPAESSQRTARVLVRLHGEPLGYVTVALTSAEIDLAALLDQVWQAHSDRINQHLAQEGLPELDPLSAASLPALPTATCANRTTTTPSVSVVVCTRNRSAILTACLERISRIRYPDLEVIVVDNAPTDDSTARVVSQISAADSRFRHVIEPRPGLSWARNKGLSEATGTLLAYTDDDVSVDPGWIDGLVRGYRERPDVGCVTGLICTASIRTSAEAYFDARASSWSSRCEGEVFDLAGARRDSALYPYSAGIYGAGANVAFDRAFLTELGGFDPALGAGTQTRGGEDLDIFVRVLLGGRAIVYQPAALVWHHHRADRAALLHQMFGYGTGFSAYITKFLLAPATRGDVLRRIPYGLRRMVSIRTTTDQRLADSVVAPRGALLREFTGYAAGPFLYAKARYSARRQPPARPATDQVRLHVTPSA